MQSAPVGSRRSGVRDPEEPQNADQARLERDRNRNNLTKLMTEFEQVKVNVTQLSELKNTVGQIPGQLEAMRNEMQQLRHGEVQQGQGLQGEVHSLKGLNQEMQAMRREIQQLSELRNLNQEFQAMRKEIESFRSLGQDIKSMKSDLQAEKSAMQKLKQEQEQKSSKSQQAIDELKRGMNSDDALTRVQSKADLVATEFAAFKKQIYDRGLLAPKIEMPTDPDEPPPVGAVALGEDVFTARLLVHLGFMTAKKRAYEEGEAFSKLSDSEDDEDTWFGGGSRGTGPDDLIDDENVHGITEMDEQFSVGATYISTGWLAVCVTTFLLQILVVLILIQGAKDAGEGCMHHPMPQYSYNWWLLHASKFTAIGVAGILMGQEIMDCLNYVMVSVLVEPHLNLEMCFVAFCRMSLSALIAVANVIIFGYLKHPATVWINMTALAFIGELGTGMLDVARRGVFGHHIMKTMTALNFELTFVSDYPAWFPSVRATAILIVSCFILTFSAMAFSAPDIICSGAIGHHANGTHFLIHDHISGGGAHEAHAHHHR